MEQQENNSSGDNNCAKRDLFVNNKEEEAVEFWRNTAQRYKEEKQELQKELDDYVEDSRQLEKELEASLAQAERKNKELEMVVNRTRSELEALRGKLEQSVRDVSKLQLDVQTMGKEKLQMAHYIRELEQKNDDLERAERVVAESVAAVEASLNLAIERNAILESEVDEKETLKVKLQRLVDETRDLKQELQVKEKAPDNDRVSAAALAPLDSNRLKVEMETQTSPVTWRNLAAAHDFHTDSGARPPAKIVALNLVNEILRKIGKLESKIAAHRANERNYAYADLNRNQRRIARTNAARLQSANNNN